MANVNARDPETWIPRELFGEYCGEASEHLLAYYDRAKEKKNPIVMSFNLLGVLAFPAWLGYRQQWTVWLTFTALMGLLPFVEHIAGIEIPDGAFIGVGLALGMMANGLLLSTANGVYAKLQARGEQPAAIRHAIRGKASKNVPLAFAGGIGAVAAASLLDLVARTLFTR